MCVVMPTPPPLSTHQIQNAVEGRTPWASRRPSASLPGSSRRTSASTEPEPAAPAAAPISYADLVLEERGVIDVKSKGAGDRHCLFSACT